MKLAIFGSTGKTGKHLVQRALQRGHKVSAYARTPEKMDIIHNDLDIIQGDIHSLDSVTSAIKGADVVINAIGPSPGSPDDLMEITAENIISAMQVHGVERLIWSTGAGVPAPEDDPTFMHHAINFLLKLFSGNILNNSLQGAEIIKMSDLAWTIARAPMLTDDPGNGSYRISYVGLQLGRTLSRVNFAEFMLDLAETDEWVQDMPAASDT